MGKLYIIFVQERKLEALMMKDSKLDKLLELQNKEFESEKALENYDNKEDVADVRVKKWLILQLEKMKRKCDRCGY